MRLSPIVPDNITQDQKALFDSMRAGIDRYLHGFDSYRSDGALIGPYNPMLHFPVFGAPVWSLFMALAEHSVIPKTVHEVLILTTGARFNSRYELYAHEAVAAAAGLSDHQIACLAAGTPPSDLSCDEAVAFAMANALTSGKQLPESTYQAAMHAFGQKGVGEIIYLIGCYSLVSVLLNGFNASVPGQEEHLS